MSADKEEVTLVSIHDAMLLPGYWVNLLEHIAVEAAERGFVVTMETIPTPGAIPAMGNYGLAISVRDSRAKYTGRLEPREPARQFALHNIAPLTDKVQ